MIDEEDDEEILKKKRSLKTILKNLLLFGLIAIGVLFMYIGGPDPTFNLIIGFTFICLGTSVIQTNAFNEGTTIASVADMGEMIFEGKIDETEVGKI